MQQLSEPLIFAVLHRKQAGNAGVTVAVLGMTWFFNQALLHFNHGFNRCIKILLTKWTVLSKQVNLGFFVLPYLWSKNWAT